MSVLIRRCEPNPDVSLSLTSFRKYGDAIACAWIRRVEGADNSDERFAAAFSGVPKDKFRIFNDSEIPSLAQIDVAGGAC